MEFRKLEKEELYMYKELLNDKVYQKFYDKRYEQLSSGNIDMFIIEDKGHIVGDITINYVNQNYKNETIPHVRASLEAFRVRKDYQNKGYGQKFLKYVISALEENGFSEFTIAVNDDNEVARHIYFKLGFNQEIDRGVVEGHNCGLYLRDDKVIHTEIKNDNIKKR